MSDFEPTGKLFKTLMHPARLEILDVLRNGEACVCHLEAALGYRQAYISQQLSVLRDANLIQDRRDGWNIYYRVTKPQVFALLDVGQTMVGGKPSKRKLAHRAELDNCLCPRCNPSPVVVG